MVTGTTMRLMTSEAIAMETALALPNNSPRIAGPIKGEAGADALIAASTLSPREKRRTKRNNRNSRPYRPTTATNIVTANATSLTNSARAVPIVPTKSAIGTAYNITIRLRTVASVGSKSWRQAATKPSSRVTTIGASAPKTVSTISTPYWRKVQDGRFPSDQLLLFGGVPEAVPELGTCDRDQRMWAFGRRQALKVHRSELDHNVMRVDARRGDRHFERGDDT